MWSAFPESVLYNCEVIVTVLANTLALKLPHALLKLRLYVLILELSVGPSKLSSAGRKNQCMSVNFCNLNKSLHNDRITALDVAAIRTVYHLQCLAFW